MPLLTIYSMLSGTRVRRCLFIFFVYILCRILPSSNWFCLLPLNDHFRYWFWQSCGFSHLRISPRWYSRLFIKFEITSDLEVPSIRIRIVHLPPVLLVLGNGKWFCGQNRKKFTKGALSLMYIRFQYFIVLLNSWPSKIDLRRFSEFSLCLHDSSPTLPFSKKGIVRFSALPARDITECDQCMLFLHFVVYYSF